MPAPHSWVSRRPRCALGERQVLSNPRGGGRAIQPQPLPARAPSLLIYFSPFLGKKIVFGNDLKLQNADDLENVSQKLQGDKGETNPSQQSGSASLPIY